MIQMLAGLYIIRPFLVRWTSKETEAADKFVVNRLSLQDFQNQYLQAIEKSSWWTDSFYSHLPYMSKQYTVVHYECKFL